MIDREKCADRGGRGCRLPTLGTLHTPIKRDLRIPPPRTRPPPPLQRTSISYKIRTSVTSPHPLRSVKCPSLFPDADADKIPTYQVPDPRRLLLVTDNRELYKPAEGTDADRLHQLYIIACRRWFEKKRKRGGPFLSSLGHRHLSNSLSFPILNTSGIARTGE